MADILAEICARKHEHVRAQRSRVPLCDLQQQIRTIAPPKDFIKALQKRTKDQNFGFICEIKKASPSKGLIRADFDPPELARAYAAGGAHCLSVLTDIPYFQGHDDYLRSVSEAVDLPLLRKDFMIDPYQIYESRALGADCILLIIAALDDTQAAELEAIAIELHMSVLVEVHNGAELERAMRLKSKLIGINNRNLKTMTVDIRNAVALADKVPQNYTKVAESGIGSVQDLLLCQKSGIDNFLIGETFMRQKNISNAVRCWQKGEEWEN